MYGLNSSGRAFQRPAASEVARPLIDSTPTGRHLHSNLLLIAEHGHTCKLQVINSVPSVVAKRISKRGWKSAPNHFRPGWQTLHLRTFGGDRPIGLAALSATDP